MRQRRGNARRADGTGVELYQSLFSVRAIPKTLARTIIDLCVSPLHCRAENTRPSTKRWPGRKTALSKMGVTRRRTFCLGKLAAAKVPSIAAGQNDRVWIELAVDNKRATGVHEEKLTYQKRNCDHKGLLRPSCPVSDTLDDFLVVMGLPCCREDHALCGDELCNTQFVRP